MDRAESRSQKRKEGVEAVVVRKQPIALAGRVFNIPIRTIFDMMAFLPPHSPELNPDEQVWNHAKTDAGKRFIKRKQEMESVILAPWAPSGTK